MLLKFLLGRKVGPSIRSAKPISFHGIDKMKLRQTYKPNANYVIQIAKAQSFWKPALYPEYNGFTFHDLIRRSGGLNMLSKNFPRIRPR